MTPGKIFETLASLGFLTPSARSSRRFDPGVGAGKLPALRAVVDGRASLVTPGLYPAFSFPPPFRRLRTEEGLNYRSHILPQRANSGGLGLGGGPGRLG